MNLSSSSWMRPPGDSSVARDGLQRPYRPSHSVSFDFSSAAYDRTFLNERHSQLVQLLNASSSLRGIPVHSSGRLVRGRSHRAILADLRRIRGEADTLVLQRLLLRWGLFAVRSAALRRLQTRTARLLWLRVGGRCFAWWRLVTERRLCRDALYEEAALRESLLLREGVGRDAWRRWRQWSRQRAVRRARATRLSLVNRQRHAALRFEVWAAFPQRCRVLRSLVEMRHAAERRLARFTLVRWRLHALERLLLFPLVVKAAQQRALAAFQAWQQRTLVGARLQRIQQQAAWSLGVRSLLKWKRWLRRRLQAALLQKANESRLLLRVFSQWAWLHQLRAADVVHRHARLV